VVCGRSVQTLLSNSQVAADPPVLQYNTEVFLFESKERDELEVASGPELSRITHPFPSHSHVSRLVTLPFVPPNTTVTPRVESNVIECPYRPEGPLVVTRCHSTCAVAFAIRHRPHINIAGVLRRMTPQRLRGIGRSLTSSRTYTIVSLQSDSTGKRIPQTAERSTVRWSGPDQGSVALTARRRRDINRKADRRRTTACH